MIVLGFERSLTLARSALLDAPVIPTGDRRAPRHSPGAARRAAAGLLRRSADRLAPAAG